jgi:hypothetical protein
VGPDAAAAGSNVRHSSRTGAAAWSGGSAGDAVSDGGTAAFTFPELLLAADGDAYAAWLEGSGDLRAARRAVGSATSFGSPSAAIAALSSVTGVVAALEPGTEFLHVFWRVESGGSVTFSTRRHETANLGGSWSGTETLHGPVAISGSVDMSAWADSTNRVVFAFQAPLAAGDTSRMLARVRTSGAGSYAAVSNLTASFSLPCAALTVATNSSGSAVVAWRQGDEHALPLADVFAAVYSSGGTLSTAVNVSQTPSIGSHAPFVARMTSASSGHLFWHETTLSPDAHDIGYSLKP